MAATRRVDLNDQTLTHLLLCEPPTVIKREGQHFAMAYMSRDEYYMKHLCDIIGANSNLKDVCFDVPRGDVVADPTIFEGLARNTSIYSLGISRCEVSSGVGHEVLGAFAQNAIYLRKLALWRCRIRNQGVDALAFTMRRCVNLKEISLSSCLIDDSIISAIIPDLKRHYQLEKLDLSCNRIRSVGCEAIAALLEGPRCIIQVLDLSNNNIDATGATTIANGLKNNDKLEGLYLDENDDVTLKGYNSFRHVMCDTSSLNATYLSNHTLCMIATFGRVKVAGNMLYDDEGIIPRNLLTLIELNGRTHDKRVVKREKILRYHLEGEFNMEPFAVDAEEGAMTLKVVPHLLSWVGRSKDCRSVSAMYRFVQQMPATYATPLEDGNVRGTHKNKRRSVFRKPKVSAMFGSLRKGIKGKAKSFSKKCSV